MLCNNLAIKLMKERNLTHSEEYLLKAKKYTDLNNFLSSIPFETDKK